MRALDDAGAYTGRAPLQLGKPIGAIVGPYRINSVAYEAISVTTNKTVQEAVRGFGQGADQFRHRDRHRQDRPPARARPQRDSPPQLYPP
ncbi:MAG: molybdopterin cofactor-binding domain-containing protein [Pseudomonadota bacterium]